MSLSNSNAFASALSTDDPASIPAFRTAANNKGPGILRFEPSINDKNTNTILYEDDTTVWLHPQAQTQSLTSTKSNKIVEIPRANFNMHREKDPVTNVSARILSLPCTSTNNDQGPKIEIHVPETPNNPVPVWAKDTITSTFSMASRQAMVSYGFASMSIPNPSNNYSYRFDGEGNLFMDTTASSGKLALINTVSDVDDFGNVGGKHSEVIVPTPFKNATTTTPAIFAPYAWSIPIIRYFEERKYIVIYSSQKTELGWTYTFHGLIDLSRRTDINVDGNSHLNFGFFLRMSSGSQQGLQRSDVSLINLMDYFIEQVVAEADVAEDCFNHVYRRKKNQADQTWSAWKSATHADWSTDEFTTYLLSNPSFIKETSTQRQIMSGRFNDGNGILSMISNGIAFGPSHDSDVSRLVIEIPDITRASATTGIKGHRFHLKFDNIEFLTGSQIDVARKDGAYQLVDTWGDCVDPSLVPENMRVTKRVTIKGMLLPHTTIPVDSLTHPYPGSSVLVETDLAGQWFINNVSFQNDIEENYTMASYKPMIQSTILPGGAVPHVNMENTGTCLGNPGFGQFHLASKYIDNGYTFVQFWSLFEIMNSTTHKAYNLTDNSVFCTYAKKWVKNTLIESEFYGFFLLSPSAAPKLLNKMPLVRLNSNILLTPEIPATNLVDAIPATYEKNTYALVVDSSKTLETDVNKATDADEIARIYVGLDDRIRASGANGVTFSSNTDGSNAIISVPLTGQVEGNIQAYPSMKADMNSKGAMTKVMTSTPTGTYAHTSYDVFTSGIKTITRPTMDSTVSITVPFVSKSMRVPLYYTPIATKRVLTPFYLSTTDDNAPMMFPISGFLDLSLSTTVYIKTLIPGSTTEYYAAPRTFAGMVWKQINANGATVVFDSTSAVAGSFFGSDDNSGSFLDMDDVINTPKNWNAFIVPTYDAGNKNVVPVVEPSTKIKQFLKRNNTPLKNITGETLIHEWYEEDITAVPANIVITDCVQTCPNSASVTAHVIDRSGAVRSIPNETGSIFGFSEKPVTFKWNSSMSSNWKVEEYVGSAWKSFCADNRTDIPSIDQHQWHVNRVMSYDLYISTTSSSSSSSSSTDSSSITSRRSGSIANIDVKYTIDPVDGRLNYMARFMPDQGFVQVYNIDGQDKYSITSTAEPFIESPNDSMQPNFSTNKFYFKGQLDLDNNVYLSSYNKVPSTSRVIDGSTTYSWYILPTTLYPIIGTLVSSDGLVNIQPPENYRIKFTNKIARSSIGVNISNSNSNREVQQIQNQKYKSGSVYRSTIASTITNLTDSNNNDIVGDSLILDRNVIMNYCWTTKQTYEWMHYVCQLMNILFNFRAQDPENSNLYVPVKFSGIDHVQTHSGPVAQFRLGVNVSTNPAVSQFRLIDTISVPLRIDIDVVHSKSTMDNPQAFIRPRDVNSAEMISNLLKSNPLIRSMLGSIAPSDDVISSGKFARFNAIPYCSSEFILYLFAKARQGQSKLLACLMHDPYPPNVSAESVFDVFSPLLTERAKPTHSDGMSELIHNSKFKSDPSSAAFTDLQQKTFASSLNTIISSVYIDKTSSTMAAEPTYPVDPAVPIPPNTTYLTSQYNLLVDKLIGGEDVIIEYDGNVDVDNLGNITNTGAFTSLKIIATGHINVSQSIQSSRCSIHLISGLGITINAAITTNECSIVLNSGTDTTISNPISVTLGNLNICVGNDINVDAFLTVVGVGSTVPVQSGEQKPGLYLISGANADGLGTVTVSTGNEISCSQVNAVVYYNPTNYTTPKNYNEHANTMDGTNILSKMLVHLDGASKMYQENNTQTNLNGYKNINNIGEPIGVSLNQSIGYTINFVTPNVGSNKLVKFSGYSLGGANTAAYQFPFSNLDPEGTFRTRGDITIPPAIPQQNLPGVTAPIVNNDASIPRGLNSLLEKYPNLDLRQVITSANDDDDNGIIMNYNLSQIQRILTNVITTLQNNFAPQTLLVSDKNVKQGYTLTSDPMNTTSFSLYVPDESSKASRGIPTTTSWCCDMVDEAFLIKSLKTHSDKFRVILTPSRQFVNITSMDALVNSSTAGLTGILKNRSYEKAVLSNLGGIPVANSLVPINDKQSALNLLESMYIKDLETGISIPIFYSLEFGIELEFSRLPSVSLLQPNDRVILSKIDILFNRKEFTSEPIPTTMPAGVTEDDWLSGEPVSVDHAPPDSVDIAFPPTPSSQDMSMAVSFMLARMRKIAFDIVKREPIVFVE